MESFATFFRQLLQSSAASIFSNSTHASADNDSAENHQLLNEELQRLANEPQQAHNIARAIDSDEVEVLRDFDLQAFLDHFDLDAIARVTLLQHLRTANKVDLRQKGEL